MTPIEKAIGEIEESEDFLLVIDRDCDLEALVSSLNTRNYRAVIIDQAPVTNTESLMHAFYQNAEFPDYFGFNWDALKDVLTDIESEPGQDVLFAFNDLGRLPENDRNELLEIVEDANEVRDEQAGIGRVRILTLKS